MKFIIKNAINSRPKLITLAIISLSWLALTSAQMIQIVFFEALENNIYLNLIIVTCTEFMASLFSKVMFKIFTRRVF